MKIEHLNDFIHHIVTLQVLKTSFDIALNVFVLDMSFIKSKEKKEKENNFGQILFDLSSESRS